MYCLLALFFLTAAEASLRLTANQNEIANPDSPLVLTCNYAKDGQTNIESLTSLILMRKKDDPGVTKFTDLVGVSSFRPNRVIQKAGFQGVASGRLEPSGNSFIQAEYRRPTKEQSGIYKCVANGVDFFGHPIQMEKTVIITHNEEDVAITLKRLRDRVDVLERGKKEIEEKFGMCDLKEKTLTERTEKLDSKIAKITGFFNKTSFYIFVRNGLEFYYKVKFCKNFNGYPAEINSEEEFLFLQEVGKEVSSDDYLLGMKMNTLGGPYVGYTHPNDPMYTGHWLPSEPTQENLKQWVILDVNNGRVAMADYNKDYNGDGTLCEVSTDKQ